MGGWSMTCSLLAYNIGHLSEGHLRRIPQVAEGLNFTGTFDFCKECAFAKQTRRNSKYRPRRYTIRLSRVHIDISGPHPVSARGERYNLVLLDEATRWRWSYAIKAKGDVPGHIRNWMRQVENLTG